MPAAHNLNIIKPSFCVKAKVSVQEVVALGGHFTTLCPEVNCYEVICGQIKNILTFKDMIHIYLPIKMCFCVNLCVLSCFLCVIIRLAAKTINEILSKLLKKSITKT